jgi:5-methylcytosine-specific restriction enzyme subunit McrC
VGRGRYVLRSRQYVGNIVLPSHTIIIRPKIPNLNFFLMLAYAYELMELREDEFLYPKDREIFDVVLGVFLNRVERLAKRGISKGYDEREESLSCVRGRVLVSQDLRRNPFLHHRIQCRYSDFDTDTPENRILKCTLYKASQMKVGDGQLNTAAKKIFHYFDSVSLSYMTPKSLPKVVYNRLNQHYEVLLNLAKLVLENSSLSFQETGEIAFSSFLVDMNLLFQKFLTTYLKRNLEGYVVKGASRLGGPYALTETGEWSQNPDIVIKRGSTPVLVMDAKYKILNESDHGVIQSDVAQVLAYTFAVGVPLAVLIYPKCEGTSIVDSEPKKIREIQKKVGRKVVNLTGATRKEFYKECDKFVDYVRSVAS